MFYLYCIYRDIHVYSAVFCFGMAPFAEKVSLWKGFILALRVLQLQFVFVFW